MWPGRTEESRERPRPACGGAPSRSGSRSLRLSKSSTRTCHSDFGVHLLRTESGDSARYRLAGAWVLRGFASARRNRSVSRGGAPGRGAARGFFANALAGTALRRRSPEALCPDVRPEALCHPTHRNMPMRPSMSARFRTSRLPPWPLRKENSSDRRDARLSPHLRFSGSERRPQARENCPTCIPFLRTVPIP